MLFFLLILFFLSCKAQVCNSNKDLNAQCAAIAVVADIQYDALTCQTSYFYNISGPSFNFWDLSGILATQDVIVNSSFVSTKPCSNSSLACPGKFRGTTKSASLTLLGHPMPVNGYVYVSFDYFSCFFNISVPGRHSFCPPIDCVLDRNVSNAKCSDCNAQCLADTNQVVGNAVCTFSTSVSAKWGGSTCPSSLNVPCTTTCTANCAMSLEPAKTCTANCLVPTVTMTQMYTTAVSKQKLGASCDPKLSFITSVCSTNCFRACTLNMDPRAASSAGCAATCNGSFPFPEAIATFTRPTLVPAAPGGSPCPDPEFVSTCTAKCPVNCKLELEPGILCRPDCNNPTKTVTRFWNTATPSKNSGAPCPTDSLYVRQSCSMNAYDKIRSCAGTCIVDGIPFDECAFGCAAGKAAPFITTSTYPITVKTPDSTMPVCPTITSTCSCRNCILYPIATRIDKCDASCAANDGKYAFGRLTRHYSVSAPEMPDGTCITRSIFTCTKYCSCEYTSTDYGSCTISATVQTSTPWYAVGTRTAVYFGQGSLCTQTATFDCFSTLSPVSCRVSAYCPDCQCTLTPANDYTLDFLSSCPTSTLTAASFGGNCASSSINTCYKVCPGCLYASTLCECKYTASTTINPTATVYDGFEACSASVLRNQNNVDSLGRTVDSLPKCPVKVTENKGNFCTTTLSAGQCLYTASTCGRCTFTKSSASVYEGLKTCDYVDFRAKLAPANCRSIAKSIGKCSSTVAPQNCRVVQYATPCSSYSCQPTDSVVSWTQAYTQSTLISARFGGSCTVPPSRIKTCVQVCRRDVNPWPFTPLSPLSDVNGVFLENSFAISAQAGGRLLFCSNASLIEYNVGTELFDRLKQCDSNSGRALYVRGDLLMSGNVLGGSLIADGNCSAEINAVCGAECNSGCSVDSACTWLPNAIRSLSMKLDALATTVEVTESSLVQGTFAITWSGGLLEVLELPIKNPQFRWNEYKGTLHPDATIVVNVKGDNGGQPIVFFDFSMLQLTSYASKIIWNFPQARFIYIQSVFVGSIVAPNADISGDGIIRGQVLARSLSAKSGASPVLKLELFNGLVF